MRIEDVKTINAYIIFATLPDEESWEKYWGNGWVEKGSDNLRPADVLVRGIENSPLAVDFGGGG